MYNLLVSGDDEAWNGSHVVFDVSRCVREYTDADLKTIYGSLDDSAIQQLLKFPCVFAYENNIKINPRFGYIREITKRDRSVRIKFEILEEADGVLSYDDLEQLSFELDISNRWELSRTHWAVKNVNLEEELIGRGIDISKICRSSSKPIDISKHQFEVALSFPGEVRDLVEEIANGLDKSLGVDACFYDNKYKSQLARPSLDVLLQDIYSKRSMLIVVFISGDYQSKEWCGIEFHAIRDIIMAKQQERIMYIKTGEGKVDGIFKTDGYIDAGQHSPEEITRFIVERVELIR